MPYVGNKPVNNFVSFAKQNITGNGGTSYSLDHPVTGANDIELFINNVRQEPTEAYSASGSTLTLTGAISSTDDVYVIFRGRALQTVQHPADSALEAASANIDNGTFVVDAVNNRVGVGTSTPANEFELRGGNGVSSKITADGNQGHFAIESTTTNYSWTLTNEGNVGRLRFMSNDGTTTRFPMYMYADTGIVTTPSIPAFSAQSGAQRDLTSSQVLPFTNDSSNGGFDIGGNYNTSTYRFTAPVSGVYLITISVYKQINQNMDVNVRVNGTVKGEIRNFTSNGNHEEFNGTWIWYLSANDYVDLYNEQATLHMNNTMSQFSAALLG